MKIKSFYSFLKGIKRKLKHATSAIIGLTSRKVIEKYEYESGGLLELVMITVNNPDVRIKLRYDQDSLAENKEANRKASRANKISFVALGLAIISIVVTVILYFA